MTEQSGGHALFSFFWRVLDAGKHLRFFSVDNWSDQSRFASFPDYFSLELSLTCAAAADDDNNDYDDDDDTAAGSQCIDFTGTEVPMHQMAALLRRPDGFLHSRPFASLSFCGSSLGDRPACLLFDSLADFGRLTRLDVSYNDSLTPASLLRLARAVNSLPALEELSLAGVTSLGRTPRGQEFFAALADGGASIRRLDLSNIALLGDNVASLGRLLARPSSPLQAVKLDDNAALAEPDALCKLFAFLPRPPSCLDFFEPGKLAALPAQPWIGAVSLRRIAFTANAVKLLLESLLVTRAHTVFLSLDARRSSLDPPAPAPAHGPDPSRSTAERLALCLDDPRCAISTLGIDGSLVDAVFLATLAAALAAAGARCPLRKLLLDSCPSLSLDVDQSAAAVADLAASPTQPLVLLSLPLELADVSSLRRPEHARFVADAPAFLRPTWTSRLYANQLAYCVAAVRLQMLCWKVVKDYSLLDSGGGASPVRDDDGDEPALRQGKRPRSDRSDAVEKLRRYS